jgi:hypothetical protein
MPQTYSLLLRAYLEISLSYRTKIDPLAAPLDDGKGQNILKSRIIQEREK